MSQVVFEKRTVAPGWAEYRMIVPRPIGVEDTPDFSVIGDSARMKMAKWVLSYAAGICAVTGAPSLELALRRQWHRIEASVRT